MTTDQLLADLETPAVQGEAAAITDADILAIAGRVESCPVSPWWLKDDVAIGDVRAAVLRFARALLVAAPQPAEQQPAPDVAGLEEVLETALFGTPLDDVPNRDNDDIWSICHPHLPERASDALRDHLARIETALAANRKGGDHV